MRFRIIYEIDNNEFFVDVTSSNPLSFSEAEKLIKFHPDVENHLSTTDDSVLEVIEVQTLP